MIDIELSFIDKVYDFIVLGKELKLDLDGKFDNSDCGKYIYLSTNSKAKGWIKEYLEGYYTNFQDFLHDVASPYRDLHSYYRANIKQYEN